MSLCNRASWTGNEAYSVYTFRGPSRGLSRHELFVLDGRVSLNNVQFAQKLRVLHFHRAVEQSVHCWILLLALAMNSVPESVPL